MRPASMHMMGRNLFPPANTLCRMASWIETGCCVTEGNNRSKAASVATRPCSRVSLSMKCEYSNLG